MAPSSSVLSPSARLAAVKVDSPAQVESVETPIAACPSCRGQDLIPHGRLPDADHVAGRKLPIALPGGSLVQCKQCRLQFRWPRPSKAQMDMLYETGDVGYWNSGADKRPDWQMAAAWIESLGEPTTTTHSILDVACFDGRFLNSLDERHEKSGIEIQPEAVSRAEESGVRVIARDFEELASLELSESHPGFSVVTAFDILEHTHDPLHFIRLAISVLRPGGVLILGTGNTDAPSWRWMGNDYWYCANPEHLSFINPAWCGWAASQLGCEVAKVSTLSHSRPTISKVCRETTMNLIFRAAPRLTHRYLAGYRRLVGSKKRTTASYRPPWFSARDHVLVQFRKPLG